ncbi:hypothetical protein BKA60DRAFT_611602 [Fusarium oxysporum]|nr:hypothetical protein BKA60DRAFT_611602 [Fusarium oxysporum]
MDPESTKDKFGPTKSEDFALDWDLIDAPILPEVEVPGEKSQEILQVETVDPGQTARAQGVEALEADMAKALKTPDIDAPAEQLVLFLKTHWRMRDGEISDWIDMANSVYRTAKEAGHPINTTDQDITNNHDWDSLLRLAHNRGGKALVALLNLERCNPDPISKW